MHLSIAGMQMSKSTEMVKKICPRLLDPASGRGGDFTQPRTTFFGHLCTLLGLFLLEREMNVVNRSRKPHLTISWERVSMIVPWTSVVGVGRLSCFHVV